MVKKCLFVFLVLLLPAIVFGQSVERKENASAQICGTFSLTCTSPPCFPWGTEGRDFSGATNQMYITIHLVSGTLDLDLEGRAKNAGSYFPLANFTAGFDGYLLRNPQNLRLVINDGAVGSGVLCGNS